MTRLSISDDHNIGTSGMPSIFELKYSEIEKESFPAKKFASMLNGTVQTFLKRKLVTAAKKSIKLEKDKFFMNVADLEKLLVDNSIVRVAELTAYFAGACTADGTPVTQLAHMCEYMLDEVNERRGGYNLKHARNTRVNKLVTLKAYMDNLIKKEVAPKNSLLGAPKKKFKQDATDISNGLVVNAAKTLMLAFAAWYMHPRVSQINQYLTAGILITLFSCLLDKLAPSDDLQLITCDS